MPVKWVGGRHPADGAAAVPDIREHQSQRDVLGGSVVESAGAVAISYRSVRQAVCRIRRAGSTAFRIGIDGEYAEPDHAESMACRACSDGSRWGGCSA